MLILGLCVCVRVCVLHVHDIDVYTVLYVFVCAPAIGHGGLFFLSEAKQSSNMLNLLSYL